MTSRQQRRAAERINRKLENRNATASRQALPAGTNPPQAQPCPSTPPSAPPRPQPENDYSALIAAASLTLLYPGEDGSHYRTHLHQIFQRHQPARGVESALVKRIADLQWRIQRFARLEAGLMELGRIKSAGLFAEAPAALRTTLIDAQTQIQEGDTFKRLYVQEGRLRRFCSNDLADLNKLQQQRLKDSKTNQQNAAASPSLPALSPLAAPNGFEFSTSENAGLDCLDVLTDLLDSDLSLETLDAEILQKAPPR